MAKAAELVVDGVTKFSLKSYTDIAYGTVDNRSGDEIAVDIILRAGLTVVD